VRLFEAPHTSENYLLKEMGFRIARKHAQKLRAISIALAFVLPFALTVAAYAATGVPAAVCSLIAAATALVGVLTERWLFFAEAKHTVTLYYGRSLGASA
jgi:DMSO reductase anchor subunit